MQGLPDTLGGVPAAKCEHEMAPAKLNLTLGVLGRRSDGYHDIESWVVRLDLADELSLAPASRLTLRVGGHRQGVPSSRANLVYRAARALAEAVERPQGAALRLVKNIPAGAGLGGGSSDAAATLRGLCRLWGLRMDCRRVRMIAAALGSDVPLFLSHPSAIITGRGERIARCALRPRLWAGLVIPPFGLSTPEVYALWSRYGKTTRRRPWLDRRLAAAIRGSSGKSGRRSRASMADRLMPLLFNDLEKPAFAREPRLAALHNLLERGTRRIVRMTGSGSCLYSLFDTRADAEAWRQLAAAAAGRGVELLIARIK